MYPPQCKPVSPHKNLSTSLNRCKVARYPEETSVVVTRKNSPTYGNICIVRDVKCIHRVVTLPGGEEDRGVRSHPESSISPDWRQRASRLLWLRGVLDAAFPAQIRSGVPDLRTRAARLRPFRDRLPEPGREHSKGTRSIDAVDPTVRLASQTDCLPPCFLSKKWLRESMYEDLFTRTIPPAGFTIDSHDMSLALL